MLNDEILAGLEELFSNARRLYRSHTAVYSDPLECLIKQVRVIRGLNYDARDSDEDEKRAKQHIRDVRKYARYKARKAQQNEAA